MYNKISGQSNQSAMHTLKVQLQQTSGRRPLSAPASSSVPPVKASAAFKKHVTFVMDDNNKVMTIGSEDYGAAEQMSVTEITSQTTQVILEFRDGKEKDMKLLKSSPICNKQLHPILKRSAVASPMSRPPEKSLTAPQNNPFCSTELTVLCNAPCSPAPGSKRENIPRSAKVTPKGSVAPWIKAISVATAKMAKRPFKQKNTDAFATMAHTKKSLGENTDVALNLHEINLAYAPHLNAAVPELKKPRKEPSSLSAHKTTQSRNPSKIGLNQLIIVSWEGKQQVYCVLCSVRLKSSSHTSSYNHCYNYVRMKYPGWTATPPELESKLNSIVAHLAKVEKDVGFQSPRRVEVTKDMYRKLASLAEDTAVEMVKGVLKQKSRHVSTFKAETEALRPEAASPCQVSSSNDGLYVVDDKISGFVNNQTRQEQKKLDQKLQIQLTGEDNPVEHWSVRGQSSDDDKSSVVQERLHTSIYDKVHPDPVPGSQAEEIKETVQKDKCAKVNSMSQIARGNKSSVPTGQQNPSGSSYSTEPGAGLGGCSTLQEQPRTSVGAKAHACSRLVFFLTVSQKLNTVIGIAFVWECRAICQETFYLCESCEEMLSCRDICHHMVSLCHQLRYLWKKHPEFLQMFWLKEDLPPELKTDILNDVVRALVARERFHKVDAQCVLLEQKLYWFVRKTNFSEALKVVRNTKNEENRITSCLPISPAQQKGQLSEDQRGRRPGGQLAQAFQTNQRSNPGQQNDSLCAEEPLPPESLIDPALNAKPRIAFAEQSVSKTDVRKTPTGEDSHEVRNRRKSSPDVSCSLKTEPAASPVPILHPSLNPHETSSGSSLQPLSPRRSHLLQVKPLSESTSISATVGQILEVSLKNQLSLIRKRAAETLLQSCTSGPLEHPLPAQRTASPVSVKSEPSPPSSFIPAANPTLLALNGRTSALKQTLVSELKLDRVLSKAAPDDSKTSDPRAAISSENVNTRWDSEIVAIKSPIASLKRRWDSKCQLIKATAKTHLAFNSAKRIKTEASLDWEKNLSSGVGSASSGEQLLKGNCPAAALQGSGRFGKNVSSFTQSCVHTPPKTED